MIINLSDRRGNVHLVRKPPTCLCKDVEGYLTRSARILPRRSLKLIIITQSVQNVSLEPKSNLEITEIREGEQDDAP